MPGVGKVAIGGVNIPQQINVDISLGEDGGARDHPRASSSPQSSTRLNVVCQRRGNPRWQRIDPPPTPTGEFQSIDELGDLLVSPHGASATPDCGILLRCRAG